MGGLAELQSRKNSLDTAGCLRSSLHLASCMGAVQDLKDKDFLGRQVSRWWGGNDAGHEGSAAAFATPATCPCSDTTGVTMELQPKHF